MPLFDAREVAGWSGGRWNASPPDSFRGVCTDTRSLSGGELYLAIKGPNHDGHDFVAQAFSKGAAAAVVASSFNAAGVAGGPLLVVDDTLAALRAIAAGHRATLRAGMIAVTGSSGKTTVKEMIAAVLAPAGPIARTQGNWNNDIGLPLSLLRAERDSRYGVFEVGMNHAGELAPLCALLKPSWGVITNVGPVHIEFLGSVEAIAREKAVVAECLPADGTLVLDRDGEWFEYLACRARCRVITVSLRGEGDFNGVVLDAGGGRFAASEKGKSEAVSLELPVPGEHMVRDALFAIAVARAQGVEWPAIRSALRHYRPLPMRWARTEVNGVDVINDAYNANPMSMASSLDAFARMPCAGRKWLVLGGMLELGAAERAEHENLGRLAASGLFNGLIGVGALGGLIAEAARSAGGKKMHVAAASDAGAAAELLKKLVAPGDAVLLKASRGQKLEEVLRNWAGA